MEDDPFAAERRSRVASVPVFLWRGVRGKFRAPYEVVAVPGILVGLLVTRLTWPAHPSALSIWPVVIASGGSLGELVWGWFQETGRLPLWAIEQHGGFWRSTLSSRWRKHRRARRLADDVRPSRPPDTR